MLWVFLTVASDIPVAVDKILFILGCIQKVYGMALKEISSGDFTWGLNWRSGKYINSNIHMSEMIANALILEASLVTLRQSDKQGRVKIHPKFPLSTDKAHMQACVCAHECVRAHTHTHIHTHIYPLEEN